MSASPPNDTAIGQAVTGLRRPATPGPRSAPGSASPARPPSNAGARHPDRRDSRSRSRTLPGPGPGRPPTTPSISDFGRWEREFAADTAAPTRSSCSRTDMIDLATGELPPYGSAAAACGNRREAVCPPCSAVYKRDARQLVRAGLAGGKGIPETITAHPCVFATLTAPSFGPVHARRMRGKTVLPCRPRRDAKARRCPHGRDISCPTRHVEDDPRLGQPMCPDCYDYEAAVCSMPTRAICGAGSSSTCPATWPAAWASPRNGSAGPGPDPLRQGGRIPGPRRRPLPRRDPPGRPRRGLPAPAARHHRRHAVRRHRPGRRRRPPPHHPTAAVSPSRWASARRRAPISAHPPRRRDRHRPAAEPPGGGQLHRQVRHQDPDRPGLPGQRLRARPTSTTCAARPTTGG